MNTLLCPGTGCAQAETCMRAIRYKLEPNAPARSERPLIELQDNRTECVNYFEDTGKRASGEPNTANLVGAYVNDRWPALKQFDKLWVTGSTVWRIAYAMDPAPDADLDVFVCDSKQYLAAARMFREIQTPAPEGKWKRRGSRPGERIYTTRGWVDLWLPIGAEDLFGTVSIPYDPVTALMQYPPSTHAHCRVAYNPATRALITIANEYANDEGAGEYHERAAQWHLVEAERLIKLARRSA